jgi:putative transposase
MYRVQLTEAQRQELQRRAHAPGVMPPTRDRLEIVRLADAGWSIPRIAIHLGICEKRVRHYIKAFLAEGFDALPDKPHPGQSSALSPAIWEALTSQIDRAKRTWTAEDLADWIETEFGVRRSVPHLRRMLRRWRLKYKRTGRPIHHKLQPRGSPDQEGRPADPRKRGDGLD